MLQSKDTNWFNGNKNKSQSVVFEVSGIDGNRSCITEAEQKHHKCTDRVKMLYGIQGKPSVPFCRIVAAQIGSITVAVFVDGK